MADAKISQLPVATTPLAGTELMEIVQGGVNKQVATSEVGGSGAVDSVNGETGVVVLDAADVGADPAGSSATVAGNLTAHINDTTDAHDASAISFSAAGNISATDVQAAIEELDSEKYTASAATESAQGLAELATQAETNTGTDDARIVTPLKLANYTGVTNKQLLVNSATALTDASSMDLTAIKHTLTTSSATRTFTISYTGDDITLIVTLNTTATVFTFPAGSLCISEGIASGDNTCSITAVSGDKIAIAIKKVGSAYYVVAKNFGQ